MGSVCESVVSAATPEHLYFSSGCCFTTKMLKCVSCVFILSFYVLALQRWLIPLFPITSSSPLFSPPSLLLACNSSLLLVLSSFSLSSPSVTLIWCFGVCPTTAALLVSRGFVCVLVTMMLWGQRVFTRSHHRDLCQHGPKSSVPTKETTMFFSIGS